MVNVLACNWDELKQQKHKSKIKKKHKEKKTENKKEKQEPLQDVLRESRIHNDKDISFSSYFRSLYVIFT